ncbi:MAG: putative metal-binding motif-containing protein [Myxococcales bacterium]
MRWVVALFLALAVGACNCGTPPAAGLIDNDGDGIESGLDCNDGDPAVFPGAEEACGDGKDNDCDGEIDEGCAAAGCRDGETRACGVAGSDCVQTCANETFGACGTANGPIDAQNDPLNCGECGNVCPTPVNAAPMCQNGACGRSPCKPGFFDLDGAATFGCEARCSGRVCTLSDGTTVTLDARPLPELGLVFQTMSSGGSHGSAVQTSRTHTNVGTLGESTPPHAGGATSASNKRYRHVGGFNSAIR